MSKFLSFCVPGEPVAFARAGRNGKRSFTPPRQAAHMKVIAEYAALEMKKQRLSPFVGPVCAGLHFYYSIPESWPRKKAGLIKHKTSRPDYDNLGKLVCDALNGIAYEDDSQIVQCTIWKSYDAVPRTAINILELDT